MSDEAPAPGEFQIGERLAGYRLDGVIGRGGMAVVYRAYDERLGRSVALKVLGPRLAGDEAFRQRFIRESRAAAAVDHPNIVPIYEAGEAGGVLFIAMRLVHGDDVLRLIERHGQLPPAQACHIVTQVAAALDAAHRQGLVHRDVKPANMLRDAAAGEDQPDHIYLSDFGLSKRWLSGTALTSAGEFLGTMDYVAPEQIEGRAVDGRTDQYSLACSAFEMLSGAPPFTQDKTMAILWAQMSTAPPALTSRRPGLPPAVDQVMAKALAKAPADRYDSCLEFAAALRQACSGAPAPAPRPWRHDPTQAVSPAELQAAGTSPQPSAAASGPPTQRPTPRGPAAAPPPPWPAAAPPPEPGLAAGTGHGSRYRWIAAAAFVVLLGAIGGGYILFGRGSGASGRGPGASGTGPGASGTGPGATLAAPGCTSHTASAKTLNLREHQVTTGGQPFDVAVAPGGYAFASLTSALAVLKPAGPAPALAYTIRLRGAQGEALVDNGKYLLVSAESGLTVFRVSDLENGISTPAGTLTSPGGRHAVEVAVSRDGRFAFVTLQSSAHVAVFNLRRALTSGFGPADLVGLIPVGAQPIGVTPSPDGRYLYVATGLATPAKDSGTGTLTVIDAKKAETAPASAVLKTVNAGCGPDRVAVSADGRDVWVTVGGGNALVAYSAAKLLTDPQHALIARVPVGQTPLGLVIVDNGNGARIIVADSNRDQVPGAASNLAVIDVAKALAGRPALLGFIPSGAVPRQFAPGPGGRTLLVTDTGAGQVQAVKLTHLP